MIHQSVEIQDSAGDLKIEGHLPYRLSVASGAVSRLVARAYEDRFGLTIPQWRLVCVLAQHGGQGRGALAAGLAMDRAAVSRALQGLLKRRLVEQSGAVCDADPAGREKSIELTVEGRRLYAEIAPLALAYEAALTAGLAPAEVALLKRLLVRLQSAAQTLGGSAV